MSKEVRLIYVIQFKVYKLLVLDTKSGISIYSYTWSYGSNMVSEELFSGMIQGISLLVRETVGGGELEEIKMDNARILIHRSLNYPIASVLVTSRSSKALRLGLDSFTKNFEKKFHQQLEYIIETSQFNGANALIEQNFPFVP